MGPFTIFEESEGLSKLPNYEGEVYRAIALSKAKLIELCSLKESGSMFVEKDFMSTTSDIEVLNGYAEKISKGGKKNHAIFHIKSKSGKPLKDLSEFNGKRGFIDQKEILFDSPTILRIVDFKKRK